MNRKIDYKINENDTGKTVEGFLKEHGYTHQVLVRLKQTDHGILRNGIWAYTNERLCKDDLITVQIVENECSDNIAPVNLPLDIAYEDDDIIPPPETMTTRLQMRLCTTMAVRTRRLYTDA